MDMKTDPSEIEKGNPNTNQLKVDSIPQRPTGVLILAIFALIGAILCILSVFSFVSYLSVSNMMGSSMPIFFIVLFALFLGLLIAVFLLIAYGFLKGLRWSWFLAVILCVTMLILLIAMMLFYVSMGMFATPFMMTETFQVFQLFLIVWFVIALVIYGVILFYLTRPKVKSYFHLGQPGDIIRTMQTNKKPIIIILAVVVSIMIILLLGFTPTGKTTLVSITQTPENPQPDDRITVTAEITGGSPFGGTSLQITYETITKGGGGSGSMPMTSLGDNKYSWSTYGRNGSVIWYMIFSGNNLLADNIIQIGFNEEDTATSPVIGNILQTPGQPTSSTDKIEIHLDIASSHNITQKSAPFEWRNGMASGGSDAGLTLVEGNTYKITFTPDIINGMGSFITGDHNYKFEDGTKIYYRIIVQDDANNVAVSPTQLISIS